MFVKNSNRKAFFFIDFLKNLVFSFKSIKVLLQIRIFVGLFLKILLRSTKKKFFIYYVKCFKEEHVHNRKIKIGIMMNNIELFIQKN